jgi:uncharacterized membrane protein
MNKLKQLWSNLRSSFWFMPSLMVMGSIGLAFLLVEVDSTALNERLNQWPRLFGVSAEGARQMLSTLAGSMVTVMGITFSMTLLALTLASGQYTPRVLRNFMRSRVTQSTLGVFASIFAYCLIVLRTVRGSGVDEFVPSLAVFFAFLMSLGGVGVLIFFIHHIASSIQASSIIASVARETNASIDHLLPDEPDQKSHEDEEPKQLTQLLDNRTWYPVPAAESGYVLSVDHSSLLRAAGDSRTLVRMEHGIGAFVVQDTALVSVALTYPPEQSLIDALNLAFSIGRHRTVEQDPAFGIRQIVDIALKALSPGINDTSTAVICVDYLTAILARLAGRQFPPVYLYDEQTLRVVATVPSFQSLVAQAFDQIRRSARDNVVILERILGAIDTIGSLATRQAHLRALDEQLQWIAEIVDHHKKSGHDHAVLKKHLVTVRETLNARPAE